VRRRSFLQQNFTFVKPLPVFLGKSKRNKDRYSHYIPIQESLLALVRDESVLQQCLAPKSDSVILEDFTDGSVYRTVTADAGQNYLSIILYQDSFEVVNPLGSARKKHKLLGVYFVLGNLACHNRSAIDSVQLVMLAREIDFDAVGQNMFSQLVTDLQVLETDGLLVGNIRFKVVLAAVAGDNLGSHCIGGFVKNFSGSHHICRFYLATTSDLQRGGCDC